MDWGIPPPLDTDWFADSNYPSADVIKVEVDFNEGALDGLAFVHIFSESSQNSCCQSSSQPLPVNMDLPCFDHRDDGGGESAVQAARNRRLRDNVRKSVESWNGLVKAAALAHFVAEGWSGPAPKPSLKEVQTAVDYGVQNGEFMLEHGFCRTVERTAGSASHDPALHRENGSTGNTDGRPILGGVNADTREYGSPGASSQEERAPDSSALEARTEVEENEAVAPSLLDVVRPVLSEDKRDNADNKRCSSEITAAEPMNIVEPVVPEMEIKTEEPERVGIVAGAVDFYDSLLFGNDTKTEEYYSEVDASAALLNGVDVEAAAYDSEERGEQRANSVLHQAHVKAEEHDNGEVGYAEVWRTAESVLNGLNVEARKCRSPVAACEAMDVPESPVNGADTGAEEHDNEVASAEVLDDVDSNVNGEGAGTGKACDEDATDPGNGTLHSGQLAENSHGDAEFVLEQKDFNCIVVRCLRESVRKSVSLRKASDMLEELYDWSSLREKTGKTLRELCGTYMDRAEADGVLEIRAGSPQDGPRYTLHSDVQPADFTDLPQIPERYKQTLETEWPVVELDDDCTVSASNENEEMYERVDPGSRAEVPGNSAERKRRSRLIKEVNRTLEKADPQAGCSFDAILKRAAQVYRHRELHELEEEVRSVLSDGTLWGVYGKSRRDLYRFNRKRISFYAEAVGLELCRPNEPSTALLEECHPVAEQSDSNRRGRPVLVLENLWDPSSVDSPSKKMINHWNWMIVNAFRESKGDKDRTLPQIACHLDKLFGKSRPYRGWKDLNVRHVMQSFATRARDGCLIQKISNCLSVNPTYRLHPSVEPDAFPPRAPFSVAAVKKRKSVNQEQPKRKRRKRRHILHTESVMDASEIPGRESLEPGEIADSRDIVENGYHEQNQGFSQGWVDLPELFREDSAKEFKDEAIQCAFGVANPMPQDSTAASAVNKDAEPQLWEDVVEKAVKVLEDTGSCTTEAVFGYVVAATSKDAPPSKALMIFGETDVRQLLYAGEESGCYEAVMDRWRYVEENCRKMSSNSGMREVHAGSVRGGFTQVQSVQAREEPCGSDGSAQRFSTNPEPWPVGQPLFWGRSHAVESSSRPPGFFKRNLTPWSNAMPHSH